MVHVNPSQGVNGPRGPYGAVGHGGSSRLPRRSTRTAAAGTPSIIRAVLTTIMQTAYVARSSSLGSMRLGRETWASHRAIADDAEI
jgi:hypothetical protein